MTRASEDIAATPIDLAIERIRRVYRGWNRSTSVAQMRLDWDTAFSADIAPISHQHVSVGGVDGEWIAASDAPRDKAVLYFHGGGYTYGTVNSVLYDGMSTLGGGATLVGTQANTQFSGGPGGNTFVGGPGDSTFIVLFCLISCPP